MDSDKVRQVEFLRAWSNGTWDTEFHNVPKQMDPQEFADTHLSRQAQYRDVVLWAVYSIPQEESDEVLSPHNWQPASQLLKKLELEEDKPSNPSEAELDEYTEGIFDRGFAGPVTITTDAEGNIAFVSGLRRLVNALAVGADPDVIRIEYDDGTEVSERHRRQAITYARRQNR